MKIRWSPDAVTDLEMIVDFISRDDAAAARRTAQTIYSTAEQLARFPQMGRAGRVAHTRELPLTPLPFILIYRVRIRLDVVEIVNVIHGAQFWPRRP